MHRQMSACVRRGQPRAAAAILASGTCLQLPAPWRVLPRAMACRYAIGDLQAPVQLHAAQRRARQCCHRRACHPGAQHGTQLGCRARARMPCKELPSSCRLIQQTQLHVMQAQYASASHDMVPRTGVQGPAQIRLNFRHTGSRPARSCRRCCRRHHGPSTCSAYTNTLYNSESPAQAYP